MFIECETYCLIIIYNIIVTLYYNILLLYIFLCMKVVERHFGWN